MTPYPPYLHTVYVCTVYTYSHREVGRANQREGCRGDSSQSWDENANVLDCISSL